MIYKKIKSTLKEEKGNVGMVSIILIFLLTAMYMMLGGIETNISVMTVNEVKDILETVTPHVIRKGIDKNAHKNETLLYNYNSGLVKEQFIESVLDSLDQATFKSRIIYNRSVLKQKLQDYTIIQTGSDRWVNSWSKVDNGNERKKVDFVILTTVLPLELKSTILTSDVKEVQEKFDKTNVQGGLDEGVINASFNLTQDGIGAFIKFEMRVVLK